MFIDDLSSSISDIAGEDPIAASSRNDLQPEQSASGDPWILRE